MKQRQEKTFLKVAHIASFILAASGALCVLALFYFIYYHAWSGQRPPTSIEFVLHYALPAIFAVLLLGSLMAGPIWRVHLALVLFSTGVSLLAINCFLAVYDTAIVAANRTLDGSNERDIRDVVKLAKQFGVKYDARGRLEVIDDLYQRGIQAVPRVAPVNLLKDQPQDGTRRSVIRLNGVEVLPHGGISNSATVYCNENGQYVIYQSDEHGFHNPKGLWGLTPIDILAVGDSFTQGACVPSDKNFVASIRKRFPQTLNVGMGGNGPLTELAALIEYLEILRPKIVLWFFFEGNDIWDLHQEKRSPLLMQYLAGNFKQGLLRRQTEIDQALLSFVSTERARFDFTFPAKPEEFGGTIRKAGRLLLEGVKLRNLRERLNGLVPAEDQSYSKIREAMDFLPSVLRQAKTFSDAAGSKLFFVYLPQRESYLDAGVRNDPRERIFSIVRQLGIPLIDVHANFKHHADPLELFPFRRGFHYNEKGHQLVADIVLQHVSASRIPRTD
jgi:lysophospholipase L1-like esterase